MLNKKYLVANGCSFTEGHMLGNNGAWPKFLGEKMRLDVINLGKGGSGNDSITWRTIEFAETNKDIAKDSLFVIQLTECLRYQIYYDDLVDYPREWHVTPMCFVKGMEWNKGAPGVQGWIYKNKEELVYIFNNITLALYKTFQNIITLVSYFESNGYPYIIFDGINDHKPIKHENAYYLKASYTDEINSAYKIYSSLDLDNPDDYMLSIINRNNGYLIHEKLIENVFSNKKLFKKIPVLLKYFKDKGISEYNDNEYYLHGNNGHPNLEACDIWSDILKEYIEEVFGKSE